MIAAVAFAVFGIGFIGFGAIVMAEAPAVTQEMAGILLILCGIMALGFGAVISKLNDIHKAQNE